MALPRSQPHFHSNKEYDGAFWVALEAGSCEEELEMALVRFEGTISLLLQKQTSDAAEGGDSFAKLCDRAFGFKRILHPSSTGSQMRDVFPQS